MRNERFIIWGMTAVVIVVALLVGVTAIRPRSWEGSLPIELGFMARGLQLSHNSLYMIREEILDTNIVRLIATSAGLTEDELGTVLVTPRPGSGAWVNLYLRAKSERPHKVLSERLRSYVRARGDGHTQAFAMAALTNRAAPLSDPDLRAIATNRTLLPLSWLKKAGEGTSTNKAGQVVSRTISTTVVNGRTVTNETSHLPKVDEVCRWVSYWLADGEVAWRYFVKFKADGSLDYVRDSRCDAKEFDPKYQKAIREVEDQVRGEMKRNGSFGTFGSVHAFWHLKKEKLRGKGIEWRSPAELNPNINYD